MVEEPSRNAHESRHEAVKGKGKAETKDESVHQEDLDDMMKKILIPQGDSCQGDFHSSSSREIQLCQIQFPGTEKIINRTSLLLIGLNLNVTTMELMAISPMYAESPRRRRKET